MFISLITVDCQCRSQCQFQSCFLQPVLPSGQFRLADCRFVKTRCGRCYPLKGERCFLTGTPAWVASHPRGVHQAGERLPAGHHLCGGPEETPHQTLLHGQEWAGGSSVLASLAPPSTLWFCFDILSYFKPSRGCSVCLSVCLGVGVLMAPLFFSRWARVATYLLAPQWTPKSLTHQSLTSTSAVMQASR